MARSVLWFRRDLRSSDHPALLAAADDGDVVPLFVVDPRLWDPAGAPRRAWLLRSLRALDGDLDGRLVLRTGDPRDAVPALAAEVGAARVARCPGLCRGRVTGGGAVVPPQQACRRPAGPAGRCRSRLRGLILSRTRVCTGFRCRGASWRGSSAGGPGTGHESHPEEPHPLASNQHGWQRAAGSGTDAAPYFRVLNPVSQGRRFDPDGAYVRRHVPELAHLAGTAAHEPWAHPDGYAHGYPERVVDHAAERAEALDRFAEIRGR